MLIPVVFMLSGLGDIGLNIVFVVVVVVVAVVVVDMCVGFLDVF